MEDVTQVVSWFRPPPPPPSGGCFLLKKLIKMLKNKAQTARESIKTPGGALMYNGSIGMCGP